MVHKKAKNKHISPAESVKGKHIHLGIYNLLLYIATNRFSNASI